MRVVLIALVKISVNTYHLYYFLTLHLTVYTNMPSDVVWYIMDCT